VAKKRPSKSKVDVKSFRHAVAQLKAKGLVSKRVDARSQAPTKYMQAKVRRLEPVLTGAAVGIKLKPSVLNQYREAGGFNIVNHRLVLSKELAEQPGIRRGLPVLRKPLAKGQIERLVLPYGTANILDFINDALANPARFEKMKEPGEYFTFKFRGNFSRQMFDNIEWLAEYMQRYDADAWHEDGQFEQLELFRMDQDYVVPRFKYPRRRTKTQQDRRPSLSWEARMSNKLERDARYREQVKNDPVKLARKREADRVRALRYRIKKGAR